MKAFILEVKFTNVAIRKTNTSFKL
ncbi:unnamed protein product [Thlaspi arvense]|uniref:Uncharacterized protein n=1 Tax=Thlaspi arvense TaxID=13288 RepID=A0AAU9TCA7_THLAR|nr:unnamed protein product [Thlaspi arvense]